MKKRIEHLWLSSYRFIAKNPAVILPFIIVAFFESIIVEVAYFCVRQPLYPIFAPLIRKFFGEGFLHYPTNLLLVPKLFYAGQLTIYIIIGVFLSAVSVHIYKNANEGLPVKMKAVVRNARRRYGSYLLYGALMIGLMVGLQNFSYLVFSLAGKFLAKHSVHVPAAVYSVTATFFIFLANVFMQTFFISTVPVVVVEKKSFLKSLARSMGLGFRNFFTVFSLVLVPYLIYLPIMILKNFAPLLANKLFPEFNVYLTFIGIIASIFIDCFVIISVTQHLLSDRGSRDEN